MTEMVELLPLEELPQLTPVKHLPLWQQHHAPVTHSMVGLLQQVVDHRSLPLLLMDKQQALLSMPNGQQTL